MGKGLLSSLRSIGTLWWRLLLILVCLSALAALAWLVAPSMPGGAAADLQPLSLAGHHRLLILAPHCDDETLGSAGLILAAQRAGLQVRVVIATNGDGFYFATAQDFRKLRPGTRDYVRMGEIRQQESLAALKILGVSAQQVTFLSYPDRGTPAEWNVNWSIRNPYRSYYNQDTRSPYPLTYDPKSVYAGQAYLGDLVSILKSYRPDLIVYPHPDDVHPDHWGLNAFTRLAIAELNHTDATFQPAQLTYLVHRPGFPTVRASSPRRVWFRPGPCWPSIPTGSAGI